MTPAARIAGRVLGAGLALNRTAFGVRCLLQPDAAGPTWVGRRAARRRPTQVFVRALGSRDVTAGVSTAVGAAAALLGPAGGSAHTAP